MADLKPIWDNIPVPTAGLDGDGVISRGNDPNISIDDPNGFKPIWGDNPVGMMPSDETANPVSSLPLRPNRQESTGTPPPPPTLQDRNPGTIDEQ